jgi:perosamine synthetase
MPKVILKNRDEPGLNFIPHSRPTLKEEEIKAVEAVIRSGHIAEGPVVVRFEKAFAQKMGLKYAAATSSGTAALHLTLMAMGIGPDAEVIIPSYVCAALLHAIQYVGAKPVVAEINPVSFNIDPDDVHKRMTSKTKAIIVPHLFGLAADMEPLLKLDVPIIEDCAQAAGGTYHQRMLGTFGEAAIFSFYATKVLATGEGGMVTSNSSEIIERIRDLKAYDQKEADTIRYNYKMTDVQAALGEVQLSRLGDFIERRKKVARQYFKAFKSYHLRLPAENPEHIHYRFVIGLDADCDSFLKKLALKGIGCARPIFLPIHRHLKLDAFPVTDKIWRTSLSIPIYPSLTDNEIRRVVAEFINVYEEKN